MKKNRRFIDPIMFSLLFGFGVCLLILFGLEALVLMNEVIIQRFREYVVDFFGQVDLSHLQFS